MEKPFEIYYLNADDVEFKVKVEHKEGEPVPIYTLIRPELGSATYAMLDSLSEELANKVPLEAEKESDPIKREKQRQQFRTEVESAVKRRIPSDEKTVKMLSGILLHKMYGLGDIELLLADNNLEEIAINGSREPVAIYHKKHGWCKTNLFFSSEDEIYNLSAQIGRKVGREINSLNPIMDAHLMGGDRAAATMVPISSSGNTITIRRFARNPWTPTQLIDPTTNTMSKDIAALIWQATQYELNILIAGGTASGKTSTLNALCSFMPPNQRIISIEDTRELSLPQVLHWNWIPMTSRTANPEGEGEVTMLDLMVASLRMRPDRIIVGEIRRREQAETMFEAMHTGHSVYTTMHADNTEQVKRRLLEPPISIPATEIEALHLVLIQHRDRRRGIRRALEVAEILSSGQKLDVNYLYRWSPRTDTYEKLNRSLRINDTLNLLTGLTQKEIDDDIEEKKQVLQWLLDNNVRDIDSLGQIIQLYYQNKDPIVEAVEKKRKIGDFMMRLKPVA